MEDLVSIKLINLEGLSYQSNSSKGIYLLELHNKIYNSNGMFLEKIFIN